MPNGPWFFGPGSCVGGRRGRAAGLVLAYDLEFLRLRHDYGEELFGRAGRSAVRG